MANCELSAARLRANVALRSPLSEPLAILAACLRSKVSKPGRFKRQRGRQQRPTMANAAHERRRQQVSSGGIIGRISTCAVHRCKAADPWNG